MAGCFEEHLFPFFYIVRFIFICMSNAFIFIVFVLHVPVDVLCCFYLIL